MGSLNTGKTPDGEKLVRNHSTRMLTPLARNICRWKQKHISKEREDTTKACATPVPPSRHPYGEPRASLTGPSALALKEIPGVGYEEE